MHRPALAVTLVLCLVAGTAAGADDDDASEAAIRQLGRAVTPRRDGEHVALLTSLRELRDPTLRPLLFQLVQSDDPLIQVQGVIGVAELTPERRIDPWLVTQIAPAAQDLVIAQALDDDLMDDAQIDELLERRDLRPITRLLLWAERVHERPEPSASELRAIVGAMEGEKDIRAFGLGACLLAERGDDAALERYRATLRELGTPARRAELRWTLDAVRQYRLARCLSLVDDALAAAGSSQLGLISVALLAELELDLTSGVDRFARVLAEHPGYARRVRLAQLLLATGESIPAETYDTLGDEELVTAMANVGRAVSRGEDPTSALIALVDLQHGATGDWVSQRFDELPDEQAIRLADHLLDSLPAEPTLVQMTSAVRAAGYLARRHADAALRRLAAAEDDSIKQQALMLGLFEADGPAVRVAAAAIPRSGPGRADSTALILLARNSDSLDADTLSELGLVAAGGGRVSDMLQLQAAWLFLKHSGRIDAALARIFQD